ncbi:hypothetical protein Tco_0955699 [Tanacetum coccineum]|uniref:Uncharacterized protein n=1 Tax=Tanacetum coccineum TaxID=301880 RepID=A0ABQ5E7Z7_9ASTR
MDKFNTGLGYYGKLLSTAASPAVESFMNSSEMLENQENNKSKSDKGYHAVPPPFTGNFIPHKPDLTFMDEIVESENLDVTTVVTPSNVKTVESNHESVGHEADPVYNAWSPIKSLLLFVLCASANTEKEYNDTELLTVYSRHLNSPSCNTKTEPCTITRVVLLDNKFPSKLVMDILTYILQDMQLLQFEQEANQRLDDQTSYPAADTTSRF